MKRIVIFASGSGTNAQRITEYFSVTNVARVVTIFSNRGDAYVLQRAKNMKVPAVVFNRTDFYDNDTILDYLRSINPDIIVLAGFLWKVPEKIVAAFPNAIVNIHPALLPNYGGAGMYGQHVHRAVIENREKQSGISIHYVNENYDEGAMIFQASCDVKEDDTPDTLAQRIHALEYEHYPRIIEQILF